MSTINPSPDRRTEELAEHDETWTLVPDELSDTGWVAVFPDGSYCRSWVPAGSL